MWSLIPAILLALVLPACNDDNFFIQTPPLPDVLTLYSLDRPELSRASGYDFVFGVPLRIEVPVATGLWDAILDTREGELVFLTGALFSFNFSAAIIEIPNRTLADVTRAPNGTYIEDEPVPIRMGNVYVIRTRPAPIDPLFPSVQCVRFAKFEPLEIDVVAGTLTMIVQRNPNCQDIRLTPDLR